MKIWKRKCAGKMQFINYFFASVVSFLGLLIGIILVKIAPEEQKPLEKYFVLLRRILLLLIFIFLMFYYIGKVFYILTLASYLVFLLFVEYKLDDSIINLVGFVEVTGFFVADSELIEIGDIFRIVTERLLDIFHCVVEFLHSK